MCQRPSNLLTMWWLTFFLMLLIAIDFDNTFSANVDMWRSIIGSCHYNKTARFILVTGRNQSHDNADLYRAIRYSGLTEVFFTSGEFKKQHLAKLGVHPDIWIDDSPGTIDQFGTLQPCDSNAL